MFPDFMSGSGQGKVTQEGFKEECARWNPVVTSPGSPRLSELAGERQGGHSAGLQVPGLAGPFRLVKTRASPQLSSRDCHFCGQVTLS